MEMETAAASETNRQLEAIFIATPPCTPLVASLTRTTTPRDLPTMYHFDFATMESDAADDDQNEELPGPPPPPISGMSIPVPEYGGDSTELSPCPNCSRKFNPTALRKHAVVCEKMAAKKRKPFDSSRQRRDGTALSTYVLPKNFGLPNAEKAAGLHTPPGVSRESSTVVNSEAAASPLPTRRRADPDKARRGTLRKGAAAAPECPAAASPQAAPAAAAPQDYVREKAARAERSRVRRSVKEPATDKCPHCERSFNPKAFDRHVEWCKEKAIQNNMKSSSSNTAETKAKERMEARKQYRPPNLKTKRSLNRDKYSGSQEEQYEAEMVAQKQAQMMTSSMHSDKSDSNISSGSYRTPATSSGSYKTPMTSGDEKMQRQQSNMGSSQKSQKSIDKSEIFISIDTEPNAQGRSPISPASLRHMVGNAQTPIDVLHIENGNEPEHAKFSKISDSEDHFDAGLDDEISRVHYKKRLNSTASAAAKLPLPNVEANNAKNAIEKMRSDFQQLGEEVGASMRRDMMQRKEQVQQQQQQKKAQQELNVNAPLTPSPSGDSDELSSLDGYPMSSSQSSRRGASSKLSSDSAYGSTNSPYSLSRQRSGEQEHSNITQRSQHQMRPHTASGALASAGKLSSAMMDASTQAASNYGTLKARQRMFAGSFSGGGGGGDGDGPGDCCPAYSSSSSEHSMPQQQQQQQNSNYNYQQQQSQMQAAYNNNNNNSYEHMKNMNNHNNNNTMTPTTSQHSLVSNTSNGSSNMSASMKMSKFCHECGGKFILEHAKFCMECGVRRVVL